MCSEATQVSLSEAAMLRLCRSRESLRAAEGLGYTGGFGKIRDTFLGIPIIRTIVLWGLYWVPLFWETTTWGCRGTI